MVRLNQQRLIRLVRPVLYFLTVVEHRSVMHAANELGISASGVSEAVTQLETLTKTRLFVRNGRSMEVTNEGRHLAEQLRPKLDGLFDTFADTLSPGQGERRLRITAPLSFAETLAVWTGEFKSKYPDVALNITLSDERVSLEEQNIKLAFRIGERAKAEKSGYRILFEARAKLICHKDLLRKSVSDGQPIPLIGNSNVSLPDAIENPETGQTYQFETVMTANNGVLISALVEQGVGAGILPFQKASECLAKGKHKALSSIPFANPKTVYAAWPGHDPTEIANRFLDIVERWACQNNIHEKTVS